MQETENAPVWELQYKSHIGRGSFPSKPEALSAGDAGKNQGARWNTQRPSPFGWDTIHLQSQSP